MEVLNRKTAHQILSNVRVGSNVALWNFINLYDCEIGDESMIGTFVEIQNNVKIGAHCRIQSHTFICEGVTLEDSVFIGHNVTFINDNHPLATSEHKRQWKPSPILIREGAVVGSSATIRGGVIIGRNAVVGAGAVVTTNVPDGVTVVGIPAKPLYRPA